MTKYKTPPPHSETEAAKIRKRNQERLDNDAKRRCRARREIEDRKTAKELGISYEDYVGDNYESD